MEEFFLNELSKLTISIDKKYPGNIVFKDNDGYVVMYNRKNICLDVDYDSIWSVLEKKYGIQYYETQSFITYQMLKHLNWRPETPKVHLLLLPNKDVEASQLET